MASKMKFHSNYILLLVCSMMTMFLLSECNFQQGDEPKLSLDGNGDKVRTIQSHLSKNNVKNITVTFLNYLANEDSVMIRKFMEDRTTDSLFFIPGNMQIEYINKFLTLKLPSISYSPEGKSFIIFKSTNVYKEFVCVSDDTLYFDLISNKKLGYSIIDSNIFVNKKRFANGSFEYRITDK